jgi:hypothetical protein
MTPASAFERTASQFTCFTRSKVQIMTLTQQQQAMRGGDAERGEADRGGDVTVNLERAESYGSLPSNIASVSSWDMAQVLSLLSLALLVQKYKY